MSVWRFPLIRRISHALHFKHLASCFKIKIQVNDHLQDNLDASEEKDTPTSSPNLDCHRANYSHTHNMYIVHYNSQNYNVLFFYAIKLTYDKKKVNDTLI